MIEVRRAGATGTALRIKRARRHEGRAGKGNTQPPAYPVAKNKTRAICPPIVINM
jgi:hypothetical protein